MLLGSLDKTTCDLHAQRSSYKNKYLPCPRRPKPHRLSELYVSSLKYEFDSSLLFFVSPDKQAAWSLGLFSLHKPEIRPFLAQRRSCLEHAYWKMHAHTSLFFQYSGLICNLMPPSSRRVSVLGLSSIRRWVVCAAP